jgi:hypothetical protein
MMIARWTIDARFGHKTHVVERLKFWIGEIGCRIGWTAKRVRLVTGSIGAAESAVQMEVPVQTLAELHESWEKLALFDDHRTFSRELEPHVLSGSSRWEVFRVID